MGSLRFHLLQVLLRHIVLSAGLLFAPYVWLVTVLFMLCYVKVFENKQLPKDLGVQPKFKRKHFNMYLDQLLTSLFFI